VVVSRQTTRALPSPTAKRCYTLEWRTAQTLEQKRRFRSKNGPAGQASTFLPVQPGIFSHLETWKDGENCFFLFSRGVDCLVPSISY